MKKYSAIDLEPCPFCGSEVEILSRTLSIIDFEILYMVLCKTPGCYFEYDNNEFDTKEELAEKWNRRAS